MYCEKREREERKVLFIDVEELKTINTAKNQDFKSIENAYKLKEFKVNLSPEILYQRIED